MADDDQTRTPTVVAKDKDLSTAEVQVLIPGLQVKKTMLLVGSKKPKEDVCTVDVKLEESSLEVTADIKDKKGKVTKYRYKANKLPSIIDKEACSVSYEKEKVIISLKKQEEYSWDVALSKSGLDQDPID
ncbi:uncharacterized protein LOC110447869 [Mizuhopecten yessoensis]|uniref:CS domain-containing protein n=1 Tax=Mizuhopecten yessoensis TaxID=6573 RepID=A0A210QUJ0_MIZYE|nr:uncharacterized protein LOC110447869 [Mizuhopecten yessoensis]OWF52399.1 hypothetical protein KP79_PYT18567 [Mizuhopecten yessoensis]